ncbi:universal stress protein [Arenibacter sp. 6A1]|uniref:universal stress protein n=1 Tax=Arenibacter sp. 6A1 TaxID=2720391 RepID=UPI00144641CE|nr:universal stress protein [Arenibacter sp. 6A1]NKI25194.1 universal stress protein [Arenibacter sp. 6A1]
MKNILLPTDFSDNAWNAMFTALKLFANEPCCFMLLNAYDPELSKVLGEKGKQRLGVIFDSLAEQSDRGLDKVLTYLGEHHRNPTHTFEKISKSDHLINAISETVRQKEIELIVMGTTGATGAKEIFIGSNTVKVLHKIRNRAILAVPEAHNFQQLKRIVFPTDFSNYFEAHELEPLIRLASLWKAEVYVFQVALEFVMSDTQKSNKELLSKRLKGIEHSFHKVEIEVNVAKAITEFARETEADMIALMHYHHSFMEKLTREAVVKKIGFHTEVPLLVLPSAM